MTDCSICYEEVTAATGRSVMSCGHEFHMRCIVQWLQKPDGTGNCPCCRAEPVEKERLVAAPAYDDSDEEEDEDDDDESIDATPLMEAIRTGNRSEFQRFLTAGVNLEDKDTDGDTALVYAVIYSEDEMTTALLDAGADIRALAKLALPPDQTTDLIGAALLGACQYDSLPAVTAALIAGGDPNYAHLTTGITPLMEVVRADGSIELVDLLLAKGANVHATDIDGWNVFMWFAEGSADVDIMASLLKATGSALAPRAAACLQTAAKKIQNVWRDWKIRRPRRQTNWFMSRMMTVV